LPYQPPAYLAAAVAVAPTMPPLTPKPVRNMIQYEMELRYVYGYKLRGYIRGGGAAHIPE